MAGKVQDLMKRFWRYALPEPNSGCWLWTGYVRENGYGTFAWAGGRYAHRFAYEYFKGPIPTDLDLDHLCRVRCCVNPDHLEAVSRQVNLLRSPITFAGQNAAKTHCNKGHEFTDANTWIEIGKGRHCRRCHADREAAYRLKRPPRRKEFGYVCQ